jgi:membrane-associated HD superfamily phosphohydrolase
MSSGMSICETVTTSTQFASVENNGNGSGGIYTTQNNLLLKNLLKFYEQGNNLDTMLKIINGHSKISLRIIDWFATNYAKKFYTVYTIQNTSRRFKVYVDYKLKLKAYSKKRFDPFCRWERITIPYKDGTFIQTTIGQLNFFKWAIENDVVHCIEENYQAIENDMNSRNSTSKHSRSSLSSTSTASEDCDICDTQSATTITEPNSKADKNKTRKKREELSISATKSIKKEKVEIVVSFE